MRKLLIVGVFLNAAFLCTIWYELSAVAEMGGGATTTVCDADPTQYSLDTNDDGEVDLSDFVYGLSWLFQATEAPRVCLATTDLEARVAALEAKSAPLDQMSIEQLDDGQGGTAKTIRITGCNLQIVNGLGQTNGGGDPDSVTVTATNGVGNLIVGYQELRGVDDDRTGSHNVVVGTQHKYSSAGGLVVGYYNTSSGGWSSVIGGQYNTTNGQSSSVSGGRYNTANGESSSVSGGEGNEVSGNQSAICGGRYNRCGGSWSCVNGGLTVSVTSGEDRTAVGVLEIQGEGEPE